MKWYGKSLKLRRGINLSIHPTFRCNQHCSYCFMDMPDKQRPHCEESTLDEWKAFVTEFTRTHRVKEVSICGGEPTLLPYVADLANWLLDEGFHVMVFTNLYMGTRLFGVRKSYRFKIQATFHHLANSASFYNQYKILILRHRVDVDEIADGHPKVFSFSVIKPQFGEGYLYSEGVRVRPDRTIFSNCHDMYAVKKIPSLPPLEGWSHDPSIKY